MPFPVNEQFELKPANPDLTLNGAESKEPVPNI